VEELVAIPRRSASAGERRAAEWGASRLREAGATDVELQAFRYQQSWAARHVPHFVAGALGGARGGVAGAALSLAAAASFELDFGGRLQWLARLAPAAEGTNAVGRVPARGERRRSLILVAHVDAAQTGIAWRIVERNAHSRAEGFPGWMPDRDVMASPGSTPKAAFALTAAGCITGLRAIRLAGAATLVGCAALALETASNDAVPGASDNATGVAGVLALFERLAAEPPRGTEVIAVLPGCEESGMGGMRAWLDRDGASLDPSTTLVLGLDTLGAGEPAVVREEGPFRPERYRDVDVERADRGAARAGLPPARRMRLGAWTDPILAVHAGLPAVSLVSVRENAFTNYHLPTDTPDRVDWASVEACVRLATGIVEDFADGG
jgi:peptidase M28-like protein